MINKKNNLLNIGFTLLELLVVIGIIAILLGMGAVSYSTAQKKARDSKRKTDLAAFRSCLEQYYAYDNNFKYPVTADDAQVESTDSFNCGGTNTISIQDPLNNTTYKYVLDTTAADGSTYHICATLETETVTSYCLSNQQ